ncbi:MAG: signal peptidase I [Methanobacterium sp.]
MSFAKEMLISIPIIILLAAFMQHMVVVPTESMSPVISGGDIVLVEKTNLLGIVKEFNPEEVKTGDIVIYEESKSNESGNNAKESGSAIIHRVISINETNGQKYFIVKGDNNKEPDEFEVYPEQVVGKALTLGNSTLVIPKLGQLFNWIPSF